MTTTTLGSSSSSSSSSSSVRSIALAAAVVLAVFASYSVWVLAGHGLGGLIALVGTDRWALQLLLDLVIACSFGIAWISRDARARGIAAWPFIVTTLAAGSIGLLSYLVWRGFARR